MQHTLNCFTKFSLAVVFQQTTAWEPIGKVPHTPNTAYHAQTCTYSTLLHISTVRISFCGDGWSWSSCKAWNKGALYAVFPLSRAAASRPPPLQLASEIFVELQKGCFFGIIIFLILVLFPNQTQISPRTRHKEEEHEDNVRLCRISRHPWAQGVSET